MTNEKMWEPGADRISESSISKFRAYVNERFGLDLGEYASLHRWSVEHLSEFWECIWDYCGVIGERGSGPAYVPNDTFYKARFFPEARLNFAENLLRRGDDAEAIVLCREDGFRAALSYADLRRQVGALSHALRTLGVQPEDRVAAYVPNVPEAVVGMLAATSLGAVWSSCSPDFGVGGAIDRFEQIEPKVLFAVESYFFKGKSFDLRERLAEIRQQLPSVEHVVLIPCLEDSVSLADGDVWLDYVELVRGEHPLEFQRFPFDHPLYILFSSGTTGKPKCIVHRAGGVLLMHLREHRLHSDVREGDRLFFFTTCGWMMWNWLVSGLASNATLILYDGSPMDPSPDVLFRMAEEERITIFGTSAKYLSALDKTGCRPIENCDLGAMRSVLSTGSPLSPDSFDFVYGGIKRDVCLSSISGGTDLVGCLIAGNPAGAVYRGECQAPTLGMDIAVYDDSGNRLEGEMGELVCTTPFPSVPLGFWRDPDDAKFRAAYFERFPGVWHHGDLASLTEHGGFVIYGRSDAVLNAGGVRIGTSEIYRPVEAMPEIAEALAVGQLWEDDTRILLFVTLQAGCTLDDELVGAIRTRLRKEASPRHVPAKIIQVPELPRTKSGKIVELAVRDVIEGRPVKNLDALANPEALDYFSDLAELKTE